jgi:hypothetical protein
MITEKKNADNVKDIISMDSFGNLPNMSAGEVVMRLPGVAGSPTDEGLAYRFNMRGMDATLNNVTVDGGLMTTPRHEPQLRTPEHHRHDVRALELIKGHTPDKGADSLGGTVNIKTRSPLLHAGKAPHHLQFQHARGAVLLRADADARGAPRAPAPHARPPGGVQRLGGSATSASRPTCSTAKTPSAGSPRFVDYTNIAERPGAGLGLPDLGQLSTTGSR